MSDILDDIRRQLGLPPETQGQQVAGSGSAGNLPFGDCVDSLPSFLQEFDANAKACAEEMRELHDLGYEYNGVPKRRQQ